MLRNALSYILIVFLTFSNVYSQGFIRRNNQLIQIHNQDNYEVIMDNISEFENDKSFKINNDYYFLKRSSGIINQLVNDTLVRIDNSYDDKMHNGSLDFIYKDTLYRFGGYGYYHAHNTLVYFDFNSKQWDLTKYKGYDLIEEVSEVKFHFITNDKLYVIGYNTQKNEFHNESNPKRIGFVYNLEKKEIEKTFNVHDSFIYPTAYFNINDQYVFFFQNKQSKELLIFDKQTFSFKKHQLKIDQTGIENIKNDNFILKNGKLFFITRNIFNVSEVNYLDVESVLKNNDSTNPKLIDDKYTVYLIAFVLLLSTILFLFVRSKEKRILVYSDYIKIRWKKFMIDERTRKIIVHLMKKEYSNNNDLNDLFVNSGLNINHINRMKNKCIKNINLIFYNNFKSNLIHKNQSLEDKRIVIYKLNSDFSFIVKN